MPYVTSIERFGQEKAQAQHALAAWVGSLHWVPVPVPPPQGQALLQWAGHAKNDPDFAAYLEEIQGFRQEVDDRDLERSIGSRT